MDFSPGISAATGPWEALDVPGMWLGSYSIDVDSVPRAFTKRI
jgi:hypothetical protein